MSHLRSAIVQGLCCLALTVPVWAGDAEKQAPATAAADEPLTAEAEAAAAALRASLAPDSEALRMLDDIVRGSRLEANSGWFAVAKSQTRYPWEHVSKWLDADGSGAVEAAEFGGSPEDFARLDRDANQQLTESDFDWEDSATKRTPGMMLFLQADRDANGKVTADEFTALFQNLDTAGHGFLALDDVAAEFAPPKPADYDNRPDRPSRSTLVLGLQRQEIGSLQPGPNVGEPAPDFTLQSLDGKSVTLSEEVGQQPVVLIFGNFTCGPFRSQSGNIEKLYERYRDRAKFYLVYVREAHPSDGWWMINNQRAGIDVAQPQDNAERREVAATCQRHLELELPMLVDSTDDTVGSRYSGMPNRLYLIDREGLVAFKSGRGPFGFKPRQLEQALLLLLASEKTKDAQP